MRVNVYAEELRELRDDDGDRVVIRKKKAEGVDKFHHFGVQFLIGDRMPHTENKGVVDDDTSGVTFWFADDYQKKLLVNLLKDALEKVEAIQPEA